MLISGKSSLFDDANTLNVITAKVDSILMTHYLYSAKKYLQTLKNDDRLNLNDILLKCSLREEI